MDQIVEELLNEVNAQCSDQGQMSNDLLLALNTVFGEPLLHALALLDLKRVFKINGSRGKVMFEIFDQNNRIYSLFPRQNFCVCESFEKQVLADGSFYTCKHVLAVWLARSMRTCEERSVNNYQLSNVIVNSVRIRKEADKEGPMEESSALGHGEDQRNGAIDREAQLEQNRE